MRVSFVLAGWLGPQTLVRLIDWLPRLRFICHAFPIPSGSSCALASLFTSVQHCLEMLVHYLVTLSYKPVRCRLHSWMNFSNLRLTLDDFTGLCFSNEIHFALRVEARTPPHHSAYNSPYVLSRILLPWLLFVNKTLELFFSLPCIFLGMLC